MRDFKGMKRQRGRNRGGGGGAKPQQNANRAFDSNGPENIKVRGHAQHVFEKYQQLARDAASAGDRVLAENFLQHAEHYFRLLRTLQPNRPVSDFIARDNFASGYDIDFEDESGAQALPDEQPADGDGGEGGDQQSRGDYQNQSRENRDFRDREPNRDGQGRDGRWENRQGRDRNRFDRDRPRDDRPRDDRGYRAEGQDGEPRQEGQGDRGYRDRDDRSYRDDRPRDDRPRDDRPRDDRPRDDRPRDDRPRDDRPRDDRPRDERPREDRPREDRGYRDDRPRRDRFEARDRGARDDRGERDPIAVIEPQAEPLVAASAPAEDRRRMLRSSDGEVSHAPAFLQAAAPSTSEGEDSEAAPAKRPRGRPRKPKAEESTGEE